MHAINRCRVCKSKNLKDILSLGNVYLSEFRKNNTKPQSFPLEIVLCQNCLLLQLKHTTPQNLLYNDGYGYKSGINLTMKNELQDVTKKAVTYLKKKKTKVTVMDIGSNDGTLLKYYPKSYFKVAVEPIKKLAEESRRYVDIIVQDFFSLKAIAKKTKIASFDIITAISCFYDLDDPNAFVADIKKLLHNDGVFVIQQNYLLKMVEQNAFDNIVHEHLEYYSISSLQNLLDMHDLEIVDVEMNDINGGSFRTYIKHASKVKQFIKKEEAFGLDQKKTYDQFSKNIHKVKNKVHTFIKKETGRGKTVYVYGASTRGNTLLQYFGLDNKLIKAAVERNPEKWGKKIASVGIPIISEEQARSEKPDYMLVLPWFFKDEFLEREKQFLKKGGHFIFPLPDLEIV